MPNLTSALLALSDMAAALGLAERFTVDATGTYRLRLHILIQQAWNGEIDQAEFEKRMKALVTDTALAALIAGLLDAGVGSDDLDEAIAMQQQDMEDWIEDQLSFVAAFALAVLTARGNLDQRLPILGDRLSWWVTSLAAFQAVSTARTPARRDEMLTFVGNDGKESCRECQAMKGRRMKASYWIDNDLIPGIPGTKSYSCEGWRCEHLLENDQGVRRLP